MAAAPCAPGAALSRRASDPCSKPAAVEALAPELGAGLRTRI
jgi:hypothetical protein